MRLSHLRPLLVGAVATGFAVALARQGVAALGAPIRHPLGLADLVVRVSVLALLICLGWAWSAVLACVTDALRERANRTRPGIPPGLRRLVLLACGVTLVATSSPALASSDLGHDPAAQVATLIAGLPLPERTTDAAASPRHRDVGGQPTSVQVHAGDSLWAITERLLPGADTEAVARGWRQLYRANQGLIGADPGLIRPGMRLTVPEALSTGSTR